MVSNSLHITEEALVAALERIRVALRADAEYQAMRATLPGHWPI